MAKLMRHGDAERMYDFMVLLGLNPVPWQFDFLQKMEQLSLDEQFASIAQRWLKEQQ
ncbi:hypothetical protein SEA_LIZZIANA_46 [Mycobacterium phage Lizziana]|uniref:Uncharacterized protein n=1 Tax=Mycobacterium phage Lizziana TaxID=2419980 RepID=A0A3G2KH89_9CAUD|nr:hypothetical protein I5H58_gp046 [Mycobacterium phage Lizziana]AYN58349.1 hypothetical protein SEA_LIZZIANA_46 [Mycobacterium phage Lizziana]UVK60488.1 hypothetical protein SEA_SABBB_44 [Mycobacterium phage Sabbb]